MESWLWRGMLAAAIALPALCGVARAQSTDNDGCSNKTLKGDYAFAVTGWNLINQLWVPEFIVGITQFDGNAGGLPRRGGSDDSPRNRLSNGSNRYLHG